MKAPHVSIIGTGYVGLVTGIVLSKIGYNTICLDIEKEKIDKLNNGIPSFYEPGLKEALNESIESGKLRGSTDSVMHIAKSDIIFICVGTPSKEDGSANLEYIENASREIGYALKKTKNYSLVVVKSTVPPGTTENVIKEIIEEHSEKKTGRDFGLCMNPEFLREGNALQDGLNPDRIVIGEYDTKSGDELSKLYNKFASPIYKCSIKTAELMIFTKVVQVDIYCRLGYR